MSAFVPYIYAPYPNLAAEESERPFESTPVRAVEAVTPARAVESEAERPPRDFSSDADATILSMAARSTQSDIADRAVVANQQTTGATAEQVITSIRNNTAIRELVASLANYDNSLAQARFNRSLAMFVSYGGAYTVSGEVDPISILRAQENNAYSNMGFSNGRQATNATRASMAEAIDRWLQGTGVFLPPMLDYSSGDGFRVAPLSQQSRLALRSADVMATYERARIAQYLREMAALTPSDFLFYDPTGLGDLPLEERRLFLRRMEEILRQENIDARAAELRYEFDEQGRLDAERLELADEEAARIRQDRIDEVSGYYGELRNSIRQYGPGIISSALSL